MSIRDDFFANKAVGALWDVAVSIKRGNPLPLDSNSVFASYEALETYVAGPLAYPGPKRITTGKYFIVGLPCASFPCTRLLTTKQQSNPYFFFPRKEVIQPHLPIRLPCYDFTPVIRPAFDGSFLKGQVTGFGHFRLPWCDGRCVQDPGTYSPRHSDSRLLAIPASCSRVADYNPN